MAYFSLALLALVASTFATVNGGVSGMAVDGFADPEQCYSALEAADSISDDRMISPNEYVSFVQEFGHELGSPGFLSDVSSFAALPLVLQSNFYILACLCQTNPNDNTCCVGANAGLETAGAFANETPSSQQQTYLFLVCSLTSMAVDRVLESRPPSPSPSSAPTPSQSPGPSDTLLVTVGYNIAVQGARPQALYEGQLIDAMDSLAPEILQAVRRQLRQFRLGRKLRSVQLSTAIDLLDPTECPTTFPAESYSCESITASILLLFQPNEGDPEAVADGFQDNIEIAIEDGDLQDKLDFRHPGSGVIILDSKGRLGPGQTSIPGVQKADGTIGGGGVAGVVIGSIALLALIGLFVTRRQPPKESHTLEPAPKDLQLEQPDDDLAIAEAEATLGATSPDYGKGKDAMVDLDEDHPAAMSHDSSSNAGSSGWSSSAGVSSLNTGSADGLDIDHPVTGMGLATMRAQTKALQTTTESSTPNMPVISRADLDSAIEAGDWAAVGATAALLAAASDSQSFSSHSKSREQSGTHSRSGSSVSSMDAARAAELDHLVDAGDWEGVVLAAAKYEAGDSRGSVASDSQSRSTEQKTMDSSVASSKAQKRSELRAVVEDLVRRVVPEEIQNVDEMMLQFRGREEELVETLRTMQERAVAQKARQGAQKAAKQQAKQSVNTQRAADAALVPSPAKSSSSGSGSGSASSGGSASRDSSKDLKGDSGSFPASSSRSLGTGQVTTQASTKSLGTGQVEGPAKSKSLGTGTVQATKRPSEREQKQSALEMAIEAGDWEAVGEAAAMLSDHSMASSADTDEINRLADGVSSQGSSDPRTHEERADELDDLIDQGDWTGVAQVASGYKKAEDPEKSKREVEEARRQRRLKRLQEEQDALAQAEIWMAIAEQSKQDSQHPDQGASEAADWAIARSLNALVEAEHRGKLSDDNASSPPQLKDENDEEEEV